jgi:hypothetical protein
MKLVSILLVLLFFASCGMDLEHNESSHSEVRRTQIDIQRCGLSKLGESLSKYAVLGHRSRERCSDEEFNKEIRGVH